MLTIVCCHREDATAVLDLYLQHVVTDTQLMSDEALARHHGKLLQAQMTSRVLPAEPYSTLE